MKGFDRVIKTEEEPQADPKEILYNLIQDGGFVIGDLFAIARAFGRSAFVEGGPKDLDNLGVARTFNLLYTFVQHNRIILYTAATREDFESYLESTYAPSQLETEYAPLYFALKDFFLSVFDGAKNAEEHGIPAPQLSKEAQQEILKNLIEFSETLGINSIDRDYGIAKLGLQGVSAEIMEQILSEELPPKPLKN